MSTDTLRHGCPPVYTFQGAHFLSIMQALRLFSTFLVALPLGGCLGLEYFFEETGIESDTDIDTDTDLDVDTDTDSDTDSDTDIGTIEVVSVDPDYGSNGGGSSIEIRGGPFDQSVEVMFGNSEATILQVNQGIVRVQTAVSSQEGLVDVTVTTEDGAGKLSDGFTYWPDATGKAGAFGELRWVHWMGDYWSSPPADEGLAWWALVQPTDEHFYHWAFSPTDDSCTSDYFYSNSISNYNLGVTNTSFHVNGKTINLTDSNSNQIWETTLSNGDFVPGASYHLNEISGSGFPTFDVQNLIEAPTSFVVTNPYMDGTTPPTVGRSFAVTWSGATADRMVIIMERLDANYTSQEIVTCVARNDGSFSIPSSAWSGWQSGGIVFILVGALNEGGGGTFPFNNSESRVSSTFFMAGGAFTQ